MTTPPPDGEPWQEAILAVYLLVLPEPLPIAHHSTWTQEVDEREPLLDGQELRPLDTLPPTRRTEDGEGQNLVSLRFWQVLDDQAADVGEFVHRSRLAGRVAEALNPEAVRDPEGIAEAQPEGERPYRTVVEAVTFVARPDDLLATEEKPDPLTRCIEVLTAFHRAFRVATRKHVPELTYERLHPAVMWLRKPAFEPDARPEPAGMFLLNNSNFPVDAPTPLDSGVFHNVAQYNTRTRAGDPFGIYTERRLEAEIEAWTNGRPRESVVQTGIAAEVLLGAVLGLAMWEEHKDGRLTIEEAAEVLSTDLTPRIRSQYSKRFGGNWALDADPMRRWDTTIAAVRNRVVHAGFEPEKPQAHEALDALLALESYIGDRLADRWRNYPRTAWLFLGTEGFRKRGTNRLRAAQEWTDQYGLDAVAWVRDYQAWREQVTALVTRRSRR